MLTTAKNGQQVIVKTAEGLKVGKVTDSRKLKGRKYYTLLMESGQTYQLVPFNKPESAIYIDGKLSKQLINKL